MINWVRVNGCACVIVITKQLYTKDFSKMVRQKAADVYKEKGHPSIVKNSSGNMVISTKTTMSKTYKTWATMIQRCTNPNNEKYPIYGGRGIKICRHCRWATKEQQARNKRSNRVITYKGRTQFVIDWAKEYKIRYCTLWVRLYRDGWSIEKALTTPVRKRRKKNEYNSSKRTEIRSGYHQFI